MLIRNATQHSVHPIPGKERRGHGGGSLRFFRQFAWLEAGFVKVALSRPAHQRVTPTVGRTCENIIFKKRGFEFF